MIMLHLFCLFVSVFFLPCLQVLLYIEKQFKLN